jgi:hypothetical protein
VCVMCDVLGVVKGEHNGEKREVVIGRITCSSFRNDATNEGSEAEASVGVLTTISMDSPSRPLNRRDSMAFLSNLQRTGIDLDIARLAIVFDMRVKDFDLEREKLCLLLGDSGIRYAVGTASSQQGRSRDCGQPFAVFFLLPVQEYLCLRTRRAVC